jgi:hypothetical protein
MGGGRDLAELEASLGRELCLNLSLSVFILHFTFHFSVVQKRWPENEKPTIVSAIVGLEICFLALENFLHDAGEPVGAPHGNDSTGAVPAQITMTC